MLAINSRNDVVPGGPVASVSGAEEISRGAKTAGFSTAKSARTRATIAGAKLLAGVVTTARKILQHGCMSELLGLTGFEWNGHPFSIESVFVAIARNAQ